MPLIKRFDTARLDKGEITAQGFLRAPAFLTRVGVFKYRKTDGSVVRELRHPDDVFAPLSLASLEMAPITDDHPADFVTPENVKALSVGWISENIKTADGLIDATAIVADGSAIRRVKSGKVELSCGYHADVVKEVGVFNGEPYDCRQTNIRYNHVAIVDRGRAGPQVRLRLDSEDAILDDVNPEDEDEAMKIKIDGKEVEVTQEVFDAITAERKAHKDALDAADKAHKDAMADFGKKKKGEVPCADDGSDDDEEKKKLKADNDKLTARVDSLEEKLAQKKDVSPEDISAAVRDRMAIEKTAAVVLGGDVKLDGKSNLDVMKDVVAKASPKTDLADKSEVYVKARFDAIAEDLDGREARRTQLAAPKTDDRKDDEFDSEKARKRNQDSEKDRWKEPLASSKK